MVWEELRSPCPAAVAAAGFLQGWVFAKSQRQVFWNSWGTLQQHLCDQHSSCSTCTFSTCPAEHIGSCKTWTFPFLPTSLCLFKGEKVVGVISYLSAMASWVPVR